MATQHTHTTHPAIIARLRRAGGHLQSVIAMIEDGRSCVDIAQQMSAVEKAITNAKRELIHDHIDHCLGDGDSLADMAELKTIAKYL